LSSTEGPSDEGWMLNMVSVRCPSLEPARLFYFCGCCFHAHRATVFKTTLNLLFLVVGVDRLSRDMERLSLSRAIEAKL
jgi:hypothetical protein